MTDDTTTEAAVPTGPVDTQTFEHGAASGEGPEKGLSGRRKILLAAGPFAVLWLLWWRLGDLRLHQDKESGITDWLYSVPRQWTVDWFDFAGRDVGAGRHKATGWVNVWFDHLRKEELFEFAVNWHLSRMPWMLLAVALLGACAWKVWSFPVARARRSTTALRMTAQGVLWNSYTRCSAARRSNRRASLGRTRCWISWAMIGPWPWSGLWAG